MNPSKACFSATVQKTIEESIYGILAKKHPLGYLGILDHRSKGNNSISFELEKDTPGDGVVGREPRFPLDGLENS